MIGSVMAWMAVTSCLVVVEAGGDTGAPARHHLRPVGQPVGDARPEYELLLATQDAFRSVAAKVRPFLVRIDTVGGTQPHVRAASSEDDGDADTPRRRQNPFQDTPGSAFEVADGSTTGIVYSSDGYIVTSSFNFVIEPILISVTLPDGRRLAADLIARDQVRKIALLKVDATGLPVPTWGAADGPRVGDWAIALGLGFGGDYPSVTVGIVSALSRMRGYAIQTDAKLSPANYGGPLCDIHGRVVGLCVPMAQRPGELAGVDMYDSGAGFAVSKHHLDKIVAALKTGRSFYRGWLGVSINVGSKGAVVINNIAIPSPLHSAGVLPGDVIVWAAGKDIEHYGHLVRALNMIPAEQEVEIHLQRDDSEFSVVVALARGKDLGSLPEAEEPFDTASPVPAPTEDTPDEN